MGESLSEPGGLAGTLLAAGARCVLAPLWPVHLDVATDVAAQALEGLAEGVEPWQALSVAISRSEQPGPLLGRPPSLAQQREAKENKVVTDSLQRMAFATWVG